MTADVAHAEARRGPFPSEQFVGFILDKINGDNGARASLRRSFRSDGEITSDALWIVGGWLPHNHDKALIWARVAAFIAKYSKQGSSQAAGQDMRSSQATVPGQLSAQSVNENSAQRLLEHMTRDGLETAQRLNHIARALEVCPTPERINWALLMSDLEGLSAGGDRALRVRLRWYRNYHRAGDIDTSTQQGETPERDDDND